MDLRRLRCAGPCACGVALVVLVVPSLRFALASQAGLVIGWRTAAMPPNILTRLLRQFGRGEDCEKTCASVRRLLSLD